jgi:hypothetical protein
MRAEVFALAVVLFACGGQARPEAPAPEQPSATTATASATAATTSSTPAPKSDLPAGNYFPLIEGARHAYVATFQGNTFHETILTKRVGASKTFYFVVESHAARPSSIIGTSMPGAGVYEERNGDVFTGPAFYDRDVPSAHATSLFMPHAPTKDQRISFDTGDHEVTLTVMGVQAVHVPAGDFPDALRMELHAEGRTGELVVARDVGVLRWKRQTGRVDELESVTFPPR